MIIFFQLLRTANGRHGVDKVVACVLESCLFCLFCIVVVVLAAIFSPSFTKRAFVRVKGNLLLLTDFDANDLVRTRLTVYLAKRIREGANIYKYMPKKNNY